MNFTEAFVLGALLGLVVTLIGDESASKYWFKRFRSLREEWETDQHKLQQAYKDIIQREEDMADCRQKSEADSLIADEAKELYLTWFKSKRSLVHTNVVEGSVIRGIERLGALIIATKGIHEVSSAFADAKNDGVPNFTRKLERVHENGEVFLREIQP